MKTGALKLKANTKSIFGISAGLFMMLGLSACDGVRANNSNQVGRVNLTSRSGERIESLGHSVNVRYVRAEKKIVLEVGQEEVDIQLPPNLTISPAQQRVTLEPEATGQPMRIVIRQEVDFARAPDDTLSGFYSRFSSASYSYSIAFYSIETKQKVTELQIRGLTDAVIQTALGSDLESEAFAEGCTWEVLNGRPRCVGGSRTGNRG